MHPTTDKWQYIKAPFQAPEKKYPCSGASENALHSSQLMQDVLWLDEVIGRVTSRLFILSKQRTPCIHWEKYKAFCECHLCNHAAGKRLLQYRGSFFLLHLWQVYCSNHHLPLYLPSYFTVTNHLYYSRISILYLLNLYFHVVFACYHLLATRTILTFGFSDVVSPSSPPGHRHSRVASFRVFWLPPAFTGRAGMMSLPHMHRSLVRFSIAEFVQWAVLTWFTVQGQTGRWATLMEKRQNMSLLN